MPLREIQVESYHGNYTDSLMKMLGKSEMFL